MPYHKFITENIQNRLAEVSIGASALRNQGVPGVVAAARQYLKQIDINEFTDPSLFEEVLDKHTEVMLNYFPEGCNSWGGARKALNLFLRECYYNRYTYILFEMESISDLLEVPLDKQVSLNIKADARVKLPVWPGLIRLSKDISNYYQTAAKFIAIQKGISRVHLDLEYWRK